MKTKSLCRDFHVLLPLSSSSAAHCSYDSGSQPTRPSPRRRPWHCPPIFHGRNFRRSDICVTVLPELVHTPGGGHGGTGGGLGLPLPSIQMDLSAVPRALTATAASLRSSFKQPSSGHAGDPPRERMDVRMSSTSLPHLGSCRRCGAVR